MCLKFNNTNYFINYFGTETKKDNFAGMTLIEHITDLLYRYDCVIIPNFGGFVANKVGARFNKNATAMYPPAKKLSFNSHLKHNDGLLINYIATAEGLTFEKAMQKVADEIAEWQEELKQNAITIGKIGTFTLNDKEQIIFEPNKSANFLAESFGLSTVKSEPIKWYENKEQVSKKGIATLPISNTKSLKTDYYTKKHKITKKPTRIKYAVASAVLLTLGGSLYLLKKEDINREKKILANKQEAIEQKIQKATFVIDNPLPTVSLEVQKKIKQVQPYHIIAGAFQSLENAKKKLNQLKNKGFNPHIIGKNKWGLIQVAFVSFADEEEAKEVLADIKKNYSKDAWLLVQH